MTEKGVGGLPDAGTIKPGDPGHIETHDEMARLMQVAADAHGIILDPPPPPPAVPGQDGHVDAHNTLLANIEQLAAAGVPLPPDEIDVEYLVIAGGSNGYVGGGGAGGYRTNVQGERSGGDSDPEAPMVLEPGTPYQVTVGAASNDSSFHTIVSLRGGNNLGSGAGSWCGDNANNPGKGTPGQGTDGGAGSTEGKQNYGDWATAGGGGALTAGSNRINSSNGGKGGDGIQSSITGSPVTRAGGGGGSGGRSGTAGAGGAGGASGGKESGGAQSGEINSGSGGGGGGNSSGVGAGQAGSGVVILRFDEAFDPTIDIGLTVAQNVVINGKRVLTFTQGTGDVTF